MKIYLIGINSKYIHPAYGVYQIITNTCHDVFFDEFTIKDSTQKIIDTLLAADYDVLGFSVYIWNVEKVIEILNLLKKININKPILLGGPEASFRSIDFLTNYPVDYIIFQEGEESFNELMDYLNFNISIEQVSNLYYKDNNEIKFTYYKVPDITMIKHNHHLVKDYTNRIFYLESSRGCYFKCSYCLASLENNVRFFDIGQVKQELFFLLNNKAKTIKFLDRSFNINKKYMLELLKFLKENDNNYTTIQFEIVGDLLNTDIIEYILNNIRKNYLRFEIGIQSTNDITTKAVFRKQNFMILKNNIIKLQNKVIIHADLIAGLPYENKQSFIKTFNDSFSIFPDELQLGFLKELQGTIISKTKHEHGYSFSNTAPYEIIKNNYITTAELDEIRLVEKSLEKIYNSNNFPKSINYLFKVLTLNPYDVFYKYALYMQTNNLTFNMQHDTITSAFYNFLISTYHINKGYLLYILKQDYLTKFKTRPKIWWQNKITRGNRKIIYQYFINNYPSLTSEKLYRYGLIEIYDNNYFLILYLGTHNETYQINDDLNQF